MFLCIYRFPKNDGQRATWFGFCQLPASDKNLKFKFLCSLHFKSEDMIFRNGRTLLKSNSVPSIYSSFNSTTSTSEITYFCLLCGLKEDNNIVFFKLVKKLSPYINSK